MADKKDWLRGFAYAPALQKEFMEGLAVQIAEEEAALNALARQALLEPEKRVYAAVQMGRVAAFADLLTMLQKFAPEGASK